MSSSLVNNNFECIKGKKLTVLNIGTDDYDEDKEVNDDINYNSDDGKYFDKYLDIPLPIKREVVQKYLQTLFDLSYEISASNIGTDSSGYILKNISPGDFGTIGKIVEICDQIYYWGLSENSRLEMVNKLDIKSKLNSLRAKDNHNHTCSSLSKDTSISSNIEKNIFTNFEVNVDFTDNGILEGDVKNNTSAKIGMYHNANNDINFKVKIDIDDKDVESVEPDSPLKEEILSYYYNSVLCECGVNDLLIPLIKHHRPAIVISVLRVISVILKHPQTLNDFLNVRDYGNDGEFLRIKESKNKSDDKGKDDKVFFDNDDNKDVLKDEEKCYTKVDVFNKGVTCNNNNMTNNEKKLADIKGQEDYRINAYSVHSTFSKASVSYNVGFANLFYCFNKFQRKEDLLREALAVARFACIYDQFSYLYPFPSSMKNINTISLALNSSVNNNGENNYNESDQNRNIATCVLEVMARFPQNVDIQRNGCVLLATNSSHLSPSFLFGIDEKNCAINVNDEANGKGIINSTNNSAVVTMMRAYCLHYSNSTIVDSFSHFALNLTSNLYPIRDDYSDYEGDGESEDWCVNTNRKQELDHLHSVPYDGVRSSRYKEQLFISKMLLKTFIVIFLDTINAGNDKYDLVDKKGSDDDSEKEKNAKKDKKNDNGDIVNEKKSIEVFQALSNEKPHPQRGTIDLLTHLQLISEKEKDELLLNYKKFNNTFYEQSNIRKLIPLSNSSKKRYMITFLDIVEKIAVGFNIQKKNSSISGGKTIINALCTLFNLLPYLEDICRNDSNIDIRNEEKKRLSLLIRNVMVKSTDIPIITTCVAMLHSVLKSCKINSLKKEKKIVNAIQGEGDNNVFDNGSYNIKENDPVAEEIPIKSDFLDPFHAISGFNNFISTTSKAINLTENNVFDGNKLTSSVNEKEDGSVFEKESRQIRYKAINDYEDMKLFMLKMQIPQCINVAASFFCKNNINTGKKNTVVSDCVFIKKNDNDNDSTYNESLILQNVAESALKDMGTLQRFSWL